MQAKLHLYGLEDTVDMTIDVIVSNDLKRVLGLDPNTYTSFSPDEEMRTARGGVTGLHHDNDILSNWVEVDSTEIGEEDESSVLHPERLNQGEIFTDPEVGVKIGTLKYARKRTLNFKFYTKSKTFCNTLAEKIKSFDIMNHGQKKHKIEYYYNLPKHLIHFISHVNALKNKRLEKEDRLDLVDYINKFKVQQMSRNNTTDGTAYKFDLSIREMVGECTGLMETSTYDVKKEKDEEYWYVELEYSIWYYKPVMAIVTYPILIWNTPIDSKFSNIVERPVNPHVLIGRGDEIYNGLFQLGRPNSRFWPIKGNRCVNIPHHDDFHNYPTDRMYYNAFSNLIIVEDEDPYRLMNIKHIPMFNLKTTFLNYLLKFPHHATENFRGLIQFILYKNNHRDYKNKITLDEDGNLTTEFPMDIRCTYRVICRVLNDINLMPIAYRDELAEYMKQEAAELYKELDKLEEEKDVVKKSPHKRPDPLYYVDEYGNIVDEEGYICYIDGTRILEEVTCECECHKEKP